MTTDNNQSRIYKIWSETLNIWKRWCGQEKLTKAILKNNWANIVAIGDKDAAEDVFDFYFIKTNDINRVIKEANLLNITLKYKDVTESYKSFLKNRYEVSQSILDTCTIKGFTSINEDFYMCGKKVRFRPIENLKPGVWNHYPEELYGRDYSINIRYNATEGDLCVLSNLLPNDGKIYTLWMKYEDDWAIFVPDISLRKSWKKTPVLFNYLVTDTTSGINIENKSAYYIRQDNWGIGKRAKYCSELILRPKHKNHYGFTNMNNHKKKIKSLDESYSARIMRDFK